MKLLELTSSNRLWRLYLTASLLSTRVYKLLILHKYLTLYISISSFNYNINSLHITYACILQDTPLLLYPNPTLSLSHPYTSQTHSLPYHSDLHTYLSVECSIYSIWMPSTSNSEARCQTCADGEYSFERLICKACPSYNLLQKPHASCGQCHLLLHAFYL